MIFLLLPIAVVAAAVIYQSIGLARDRRRYPPPGRLVEAGGTRLHLVEQGEGTPVVVFESGIGASSLSWAAIQPKIATFTKVVSYDRAGLGWSPSARAPRSAPGIVAELRSLLANANLASPYILVGHSFGGLIVRAYAALHPTEVAGLVLVDPVSVQAWASCPQNELQRLQLGAKLARRGAWMARFGLVRASLGALAAGGRRFPKLAARASGRRGTAAMTNLVGEVQKLPPGVWPLVRSHWSDAKCFGALAEHLGCLPASAAYASQLPAIRGIATVILSASTATQKEIEERDTWINENGAGRHIRVPDSSHWLHLEKPCEVVRAIREVIRDWQKSDLLQPGTSRF